MIKNKAKRLLALSTVLCFLFLTLFGLSEVFPSQKGAENKSDKAPSGRFVAAEVFSFLENERGSGAECALIPLKNTNAKTTERKELVVGGELFGIRMELGGLLITGLGEVETEHGAASPGEEAGLQKGDVLLEANDAPLDSAADLVKIVSRSEGHSVTLKCKRQGEIQTVTLHPALSADGSGYKVGLWVRDGAAGIGTVTYRDPKSGAFAGLGHAVCDSSAGAAFPLKSGTVCTAIPEGIRKGENGTPGELRGRLGKIELGALYANTLTGVYGTMPKTENPSTVPIAFKNEVTKEKAFLLCTLDQTGKKEYEIEIEEIIDRERESKNFIVHVTDPALLEQTGGIVQGMSGSPIIQDGKLVGAVTHVLVDDPTRGYGIFIENMLSAMPE